MQITPDNALTKARKYCAYQERSQQELRDKLYAWGLHKADVEKTIAQMVEDGFMNEERFAIAFAGGKFRIKHWGKIKIKLALKQKKVSEKNPLKKNYKIAQHVIGKGFEAEMVWDFLRDSE